MRRFALIACLSLTALAGAAHAAVSTDPKQAPAGSYQMETRHTQVLFAIPHFGITDYYGRFEKVSGALSFNPGAPEKSSVSVSIDTGSASVMSSELMGEIVGPSVFDSANFPTATFVSTSVERTGPTTGKMTGDMTIHGVKKPVTFDVTFNGGLPSPMGNPAYDIGFHATATIKRSDFGLDKMMWSSAVGDDVKLTIEALFVQTKR
jgi:polyisoprenoid-binding protein YceI